MPSEPLRRVLGGVALVSLLAGCGSQPDGAAGTTPNPSALATSTATPTTNAPSGAPTLPTVASPAATAPVNQEAVLDQLSGSADGDCAPTAERNVRSGGIGAGDFVEARKQYKAGGTGAAAASVTLHIIPAHPGEMSGVQVRMTRLRKPVYTFDYASVTKAEAGGVKYYTFRFPVNYPGSWRLTFTAGADKGCFDVAFNRPS